MTTVKITKKDSLNNLKRLIAEGRSASLEGYDFDALDAYCANEIFLLDSRAEKAKARAAVKKSEGDAMTDTIKAVLTEDYVSIDDIVAALNDPDATRSKVSYRLNKLAEAGIAVKDNKQVTDEEGKKKRTVVAYALSVE